MKRLAVLVSGNGTNLQAIIDAVEIGRLPGRARGGGGVQPQGGLRPGARRAGTASPPSTTPCCPTASAGTSREEYDADLAALLAPYAIDLVVLAGWMHIFTHGLSAALSRRVLNIHPALPGTFPGTHAIERAYEAFQRGEIDHTGVMVHLRARRGRG